jgi:hypothetical protein
MLILALGLVAAIVVAVFAARRTASRDRLWAVVERVMALGAVAWSVAVTAYLVLVATYEGVQPEAFGGVAEQVTTGRRTFLEVNGDFGLTLVLVPVALTTLPWLAPDPPVRRRLHTIATVLLLTFVVVGALSVGLLYTPGALAMLIAAVLSKARPRRPSLNASEV